jgi:hypothetical protein
MPFTSRSDLLPSTPLRSKAQHPAGPTLRQHTTRQRSSGSPVLLPLSTDRGPPSSAKGIKPPKTPQAGPSEPRALSSHDDPADGGISAWAGRIEASSPAPLSEGRPTSHDTRRADNNDRIIIDGIERESWEVMTQDQEEDRHAAVSHPSALRRRPHTSIRMT